MSVYANELWIVVVSTFESNQAKWAITSTVFRICRSGGRRMRFLETSLISVLIRNEMRHYRELGECEFRMTGWSATLKTNNY